MSESRIAINSPVVFVSPSKTAPALPEEFCSSTFIFSFSYLLDTPFAT